MQSEKCCSACNPSIRWRAGRHDLSFQAACFHCSRTQSVHALQRCIRCFAFPCISLVTCVAYWRVAELLQFPVTSTLSKHQYQTVEYFLTKNFHGWIYLSCHSSALELTDCFVQAVCLSWCRFLYSCGHGSDCLHLNAAIWMGERDVCKHCQNLLSLIKHLGNWMYSIAFYIVKTHNQKANNLSSFYLNSSRVIKDN